jgi:hypothetical protein
MVVSEQKEDGRRVWKNISKTLILMYLFKLIYLLITKGAVKIPRYVESNDRMVIVE